MCIFGMEMGVWGSVRGIKAHYTNFYIFQLI
nr:MAG TPA: hypothetical protein [Bacteriophage sp.]